MRQSRVHKTTTQAPMKYLGRPRTSDVRRQLQAGRSYTLTYSPTRRSYTNGPIHAPRKNNVRTWPQPREKGPSTLWTRAFQVLRATDGKSGIGCSGITRSSLIVICPELDAKRSRKHAWCRAEARAIAINLMLPWEQTRSRSPTLQGVNDENFFWLQLHLQHSQMKPRHTQCPSAPSH